MAKWEYRLVSAAEIDRSLETDLNQLGAARWELVNVTPIDGGYAFVFKREFQEPPTENEAFVEEFLK